MSSVIHMETEQVREVARQLNRISAEIEQEIELLGSKLRALDWEGPSRDRFIDDFSELQRKFQVPAEQGVALGLRAQREVEEWLAIDQTGTQNFANIVTTIGIYTAPLGMMFQDFLWNFQYADFKDWWSKLGREDRLAYLNDQYQKITKQNGMTPVELKVEDLPDSFGKDYRGVYRGNNFVLDVDNFNSDEPWRLIETMAHEARHQRQSQAIQFYQTTGQVPEGCTEEQVKAWAENIANYHKGEDDFEAYWIQPIERDAREYGVQYMKEVLDNKDWGSISAADPGNTDASTSNSTGATAPGG